MPEILKRSVKKKPHNTALAYTICHHPNRPCQVTGSHKQRSEQRSEQRIQPKDNSQEKKQKKTGRKRKQSRLDRQIWEMQAKQAGQADRRMNAKQAGLKNKTGKSKAGNW